MTTVCGPFFWILAIMALVALVTFFSRFVDIRRAQIDAQDFLKGVINVLDAGNADEALAICDDTGVAVANVVASAIRNRGASARVLREAVDAQGRAEIGRLDRRLATLAIIGQVAPTVGLLGTVVGFIRAILLVDAAPLVSRAALLDHAMAALVAAALGLLISIAVTAMYGALRVRLDRVVVELEAAASQIVGYISAAREREVRS